MAAGRKRRHLAAVGIVLALAAGVTVATLSGTREKAAAVQLLPGDAWLANRVTGSVSHVLGYAKRTDPPVRVSSPHDPFTIVARPDGAYVLDTKTGVLSRVGASDLGVVASRHLPGQPSALQVSTGGSATWAVDDSAGVIQPLDPATLKPDAAQIPLGGSVGSTVTDGSGTLWATLPDKGAVYQISPGSDLVHQQTVGQVGDQLQLVVTQGGTWAVDPQAGTVVSLSNPGSAPLHIPQTAAGANAPVLASSPTTADVVVVSGTVVSDVDTATATVTSASDPSYGAITEAVLANNQVYLLDPVTEHLEVLGLDPVRALGSLPVPAGSDQLVTHDNLVFVNDDASPVAAVVDGAGQVSPITKYQVAPAPGPVTNPIGPPTATPVPTPVPSAYPLATPTATPTPTPPANPVTPAPTPTTVPASPTTTAPAPPGAPTITKVTPGAGTLAVTWTPAAGSAAASYVVLVTPPGGGTPVSTPVAGATTTATVSGLSRGVTYCAQVQALGAGGGGGPVSTVVPATDCATTIPVAPGAAPTNLSFDPGNELVGVSFAPVAGAPAGTTYTVLVDGVAVQKGLSAAGVHDVALPVTSGKYRLVTVGVEAVDGGGAGPMATESAWSYFVEPEEDCLNIYGTVYEDADSPGNCTAATIGRTPYDITQSPPSGADVPLNAGDRILCSYFTAQTPAAKDVNKYLEGTAGSDTCPAAPAGFTSPGVFRIVWSQPGTTHTVPVTEYQGTIASGADAGTVEYPIVGPGATPSSVAGTTLINTSPIASWWDDVIPPGG